MLEKRREHAVALVGDKIYSFGGRNGTYMEVASVECYDTATKTWTLVSPLPNERCQHGINDKTEISFQLTNILIISVACTFKDKIYILGGNDKNNTKLASVLEYDPATDKYINIKNMNTSRDEFKAAAVGQQNH